MKIKLTVLTMAMLIGSQVAYADGWIMWEHIETSDKGGTSNIGFLVQIGLGTNS